MTFIPTNPTDPGDQSIANLTFWPVVDVGVFRDSYRVDDTVSGPRVINSLRRALIDINAELAEYRAEKEVAGIAKLADVETDIYGEGESAISDLVHHYQVAIYSRAKAHILEAYRDFDSTNSGHDRADDLEGRIDSYLATARASIRAILGQSKCTVELI